MGADFAPMQRAGARVSRRRLIGAGAAGAAIVATLAACGRSGGQAGTKGSSPASSAPRTGGKTGI
jgi:hypothetical protein